MTIANSLICKGTEMDIFLYTQYPIIRNDHIRNDAEFLGEFKKRALSRSNLRNASKNLRNAQCSDFQSEETSNIFYLSFTCKLLQIFLYFYSWVFNTQCWTKFHYHCCVFSQIGKFVLFNYGLCSDGRLILEKFKKRLRNGQRSNLKN